ncbi:MAG: hypothetical protein ACR2RE_11090 [Geminicoccaceae bacterium]
MPVMRTSIHGRRLGISSTGGILAGSSDSTTFGSAAQMWGDDLQEVLTTAGASIRNYGTSVVSTGSTSGSSMVLSAPVSGVHKEIFFATSATAFTLSADAATTKFNTTSAESLTGGTTSLSITGGALGIGGGLVLRGYDENTWFVVSGTVAHSS